MKRILFFLLACCIATQIYAQKIPVTGKVLDETGQPLIGAIIKVDGTTDGAAADNDGNFKLSVAVGAHLTVTYLGYNAKNVVVTSDKSLTITMDVKTSSDLNEVVVIGYGTVKKATLSGSVSAVSGADILTTKNEDIVNSLAGKLPGVRIVQNTAEPGSYNNSYDIRGFSGSGSGGTVTPPLIIIDGVPQDQSVLQRMDPNDVESLSVLKDASAAVYGVQAANGVILVTTKKGTKGQVSISYNVTGTLQVVSQQPQETSAAQWMTLTNQMTEHNINGPVLTFPLATVAQYQNGTQQGTNWIAATMNKTAPEWTHSITANGGSDNVNYFVSFGYLNQDSFFINNAENYDKYNFRSNIDAKISKRLTLSMQLAGSSDAATSPSVADWNIFGSMWRNPPINPVYLNNDPSLPANPGYNGYGNTNSVSMVTPSQSGYTLNKNQKFQGGLSLTYDVPYIDGLKAKAFYNYNYNNQDNKNYNRLYTNYNPGSTPGSFSAIGAGGTNGQSDVQQAYSNATNGFLQFSLDYKHTFAKDHNLRVLALYEQQSNNGDAYSAFRYETLNSDQLAAGSATNQVGSGTAVNPSTSKSLVGVLDYDYKSKYILNFTVRRDGSSLFPPSKQYGVFPGATAAYRISEEPFFKKIKELSFIDNFKIRGSYGILGDASGTTGYNFVGGYSYPYTYPTGGGAQNLPGGSVFDGNYVNGLGFRGLTNPNITWYTSRTADVGVDIELWKGLFEITADYYNRYRTGLLGTELLNLPGSVGAALPQVNLNSDETRGYELSITNNDRIGQVGLRISGNVSYARTKWIQYVKAPQGSSYADWVNNGSLNGRYNDVWFGYGYAGQFQSFQQIRGYTVNQGGGNRSVVPGDYIYQDWNHDGYFDAGDLHPVAGTNAVNSNGSPTPTAPIINFGLNIGATYKNLDVSALLQGAAGKWISYPIYYSYPLDHGGNSFAQFTDDWHPANPTANPFNPNTVYIPGAYAYTGTNINQSSTGPGGINNASYVRLKSLEIGYTFPTMWTKKVGVKSVRFFVNGYNLLTVTGLKGVDPEHPSDLYGEQYPLNHTFSAGLSAKF
jgi:TonB-linked SusC/RagA family outer membrane protein